MIHDQNNQPTDDKLFSVSNLLKKSHDPCFALRMSIPMRLSNQILK